MHVSGRMVANPKVENETASPDTPHLNMISYKVSLIKLFREFV